MQEHDEALVHLSTLARTSAVVADGTHDEHTLDLLKGAVTFVQNEIEHHNLREEEALFPVLDRYVEGPTSVMRAEHRVIRTKFKALNRAYRAYMKSRNSRTSARELAVASRAVVQIMVNHIHKENHILFPLVQKFLTKDALREIARRLTAPI
jgi:hemerythrin-like domain-containing protein